MSIALIITEIFDCDIQTDIWTDEVSLNSKGSINYTQKHKDTDSYIQILSYHYGEANAKNFTNPD